MVEQEMCLCFGQKGAGLFNATDLQNDPDGLSVAVKQGRGGRSRRLSQRGHTEQDGPCHQSSARCHKLHHRAQKTVKKLSLKMA